MREILFDSRAVVITLSVHGLLLLYMFMSPARHSVPFALTVHKQEIMPQTDILVKTFTRKTSHMAAKCVSPPSRNQALKKTQTAKIATENKKIVSPQKKQMGTESHRAVQEESKPRLNQSMSIGQKYQGIWEQGGIDMRKLTRSVHATVHASWKPPSGIKKGTSAQVVFDIDAKGYVHRCRFEKRSGVLLFDQSIQLAQRSWRFCKRLFNSSLTLHLMG